MYQINFDFIVRHYKVILIKKQSKKKHQNKMDYKLIIFIYQFKEHNENYYNLLT